MRTNFYIDGFNLYYGAVRGTPYKWLNLHALARRIFPKNETNRVRYFTARVQSRPDDPRQAQRQQAYIRALETIPLLTVHYGRFLTSVARMPLVNPTPGGSRTAEVLRTEEKGSDVNLATYLLLDGFRGDYELAVVISNDSDLVHPIELVQHELGRPVGVVNPHPHTMSWALKNAASFYRVIRQGALRDSQFPDTLEDAHGVIRKPATW